MHLLLSIYNVYVSGFTLRVQQLANASVPLEAACMEGFLVRRASMLVPAVGSGSATAISNERRPTRTWLRVLAAGLLHFLV